MLAAAPVDLEDDLSQAMVVIGDDLSDERAKKLLARSHGHPWRIPSRLEVVCEPDKVGYWCGGAWRFKARPIAPHRLVHAAVLLPSFFQAVQR